MKAADFDYELPPECIAQRPVEPRDASRLLVLHRESGAMEHVHFRDLPAYLRPGDLLVANESRVLRARLRGRKARTGGRTEVLLLRRLDERRWEALIGGQRIRPGLELALGEAGDGEAGLQARVEEIRPDGVRVVSFSEDVEPHLERLGMVPLPPYIHEPLADAERYQTVYARVAGSVAAPTAGLHFTPGLIAELQAQGVGFAFVVLHIGLDTFRPMEVEEVEAHRMHAEWCRVPAEVARAVRETRQAGRRVVAVGTTAVRALETAAQDGEIAPFEGWTRLFIYPGYRFRTVDALITNFHLPRSTLLLLVSAFAGRETILHAYREAIARGYRFYSFGDAMLIL
ncbi:MAG: tRNA preQ1(34) S-adenosylmethionine ribosyltransferase-isomerase QueA [Chloroflexia bacterium]